MEYTIVEISKIASKDEDDLKKGESIELRNSDDKKKKKKSKDKQKKTIEPIEYHPKDEEEEKKEEEKKEEEENKARKAGTKDHYLCDGRLE